MNKASGPSDEELAAMRKVRAQWPEDKRIRHVSKIYVQHQRASDARTLLNKAMTHGVRQREANTAYLAGNSRCGKSETVKRFIAEATGAPFPDGRAAECAFIQGPKASIVYMDCTIGTTPLLASRAIMRKLFNVDYSVAMKWREHEAGEFLSAALIRDNVQMFVIDEGQKLVGSNASSAATKRMRDWILSLENVGRFSIAVAGGRELLNLLAWDDALRERKLGVVELDPMPFETAKDIKTFGAFLRAFDNDMPFESTPLSDSQWDERIFYATRGRPGGLAMMMEEATRCAFIRTKGSMPATLTVADLDKAFAGSRLSDPRMRGVNPFSHKGTLPPIPKSRAKEEDERYLSTGKKPPRRRANRLDRDD